jgi:hypothetical protein
MNFDAALPRALAEALKHVYGCTLCGWRGALVECLDAAEHGLLCPHCFAMAGRVLDAKGRIDVAGPRYRRTWLRLQGAAKVPVREARGPAAMKSIRRRRSG